MKWGIVLDSSCDLLEKDFQGLEIDFTIAPLKILVGDKEFVDDDHIDISSLLTAMKETKEASQTACPAPGDFLEGFMKSDNVLCFTLTGGLSGTYNSARMAKELALAENNEKNIYVCDTKSAAGHLILMMNRSIELIKQGKSFEEITNDLEIYNNSLSIVFTIGSFDNLIKTGRMSRFAGGIAKTLNIHLVCKNSSEGQIEVVTKCRGVKPTYNKMIEVMKERKNLSNLPVYIHHTNNEKDASYIREKLKLEFPQIEVHLMKCKGLTTFYTMNGGIMISY